jgi:hypothetical protein
MVRSLAWLLTEWKSDGVLGENLLVVVESIPKLVSEVVEFSKGAVTPFLFSEPACFISKCAKNVEGVALQERARKLPSRVAHHSVVAGIG